MTPGIPRADDAERLRQFKAEFFKALAHPLRIRILELLRGRNIVTTERRRTTIIYQVADTEVFDLLDLARRIVNAHLTDTMDLLRVVEGEMGVPQRSRAGHHRRRTEGSP